ncbi:MAG: J domain-containing protein [bacterium]|nr:J domain-containing protein [bacterium]
MRLGKRLTRLARAHWNELLERVEGVLREEEAAAHELSRALELPDAPTTPTPAAAPAPPPTELQRAYRVLGLPENADLAAVRRAYRELMTRSDPNRFPEGAPEREQARRIQQRIEQAYQTLLLHLDYSAQRFRNLTVE